MTEHNNINCSFLEMEDVDFATAFKKVAPLIFSLIVLLVIFVAIIFILLWSSRRSGGGNDNQNDTIEINRGDRPSEEDGAEELLCTYNLNHFPDKYQYLDYCPPAPPLTQ